MSSTDPHLLDPNVLREAEPKEVTIYYRIHLNNDRSKLSRRRTRSPIHHLRARCPCTHAAAPPPDPGLHVLFVFRGRISINLRSSAGRSVCPLLNRIVYVHLLSTTANSAHDAAARLNYRIAIIGNFNWPPRYSSFCRDFVSLGLTLST